MDGMKVPSLGAVLVVLVMGLTGLGIITGALFVSGYGLPGSGSMQPIKVHPRASAHLTLPQPWLDPAAGGGITGDSPELHNGIGRHIHVFTYADDDNHPNVQRLRQTCSSRLQVLKNTQYTGSGWNWHHKLHRLFPLLRDLQDNQIVLIMDGDSACFPCTRNLTAEFLKFNTGILFAGYPFFLEPDRRKTSWFPPARLVHAHNVTDRKRHEEFRYLNAGHVMAFAGALKRVLSDFYLSGNIIEVEKFDDQAHFWSNLYLAQSFAPQTPQFALVQHLMPGLRIALDAEGLVFQIFLPYYKGKWRRTPGGHLVRDEVYDGLECCLMHFVGNKEAIDTFMMNWEVAGRELQGSVVVSNATAANETAWNATDAHGNVPVWGKCETPKPGQDPEWDWRTPHEGHMKCADYTWH